ncbi:glycosyltransferase family 39 protein [Candidatus Gracilibacteria bacterium]|nr:glycosyltransferase family 39 protein [Candidatus Gracilibacteria bacterium]
MKKINIILSFILFVGTLYHASFLHLNEVMKIADSFAYLQMSHFLQNFAQEGLGNGWFGFVYSLPIAFLDFFVGNDFLSAKIVNLILFNISALLLWKISRKYLSVYYSYLVITLFFLSPTLLHFNIHVLSENIYIPLFLGLILSISKFIEKPNIQNTVIISCVLGLMYLTRAEAFIYICSIGIIAITLLVQSKLDYKKFFGLGSIFFIVFFLFISPYLFHLHSFTGEWGLTNKGASNLRQAELRGQERMDDAGFEQAVAELTADNQHLIAGFAGGMPYDTPSIELSLGEFISKDPNAFIDRIITNQKKLFTRNLPEIFLGKSPSLYFSDDDRFSHVFFLLWCIIPLGVLVFGIYTIFRKQKDFLLISTSFFIPALVFFTLFFTLNRYFLIFLPLLLIAFSFGVSIIKNTYIRVFLIGNIISILLLSTFVYYNTESPKDDYYSLKQEAGLWLAANNAGKTQLKIMERFPIVTYYSESKTRYITPYTDDIQDIYEYGDHHNIDILIVDSMDFKTYRPKLIEYLDTTPENFIKLKEFQNENLQKVILYRLKK